MREERSRVFVTRVVILILIGATTFSIARWVYRTPPPLPYSPKVCYLVESGFSDFITDEAERMSYTNCWKFSLEAKKIGTLCGNISILRIHPDYCISAVEKKNNPSLPEEKKEG